MKLWFQLPKPSQTLFKLPDALLEILLKAALFVDHLCRSPRDKLLVCQLRAHASEVLLRALHFPCQTGCLRLDVDKAGGRNRNLDSTR